jgi:hypothetical protein
MRTLGSRNLASVRSLLNLARPCGRMGSLARRRRPFLSYLWHADEYPCMQRVNLAPAPLTTECRDTSTGTQADAVVLGQLLGEAERLHTVRRTGIETRPVRTFPRGENASVRFARD